MNVPSKKLLHILTLISTTKTLLRLVPKSNTTPRSTTVTNTARTTIATFATVINRLIQEYGPNSKDRFIANRDDAVQRVSTIMTIINEYEPRKRRCIFHTIGLGPDGISNQGGQDIIIMMALENKKKFTKKAFKMMFVDLDVKRTKQKETVQVAGAIVGGIKSGLKKRPERERFRSPWWLDLYPPGLRGPAIRKRKEAHDARMLALRTERLRNKKQK